MSAPEFPAVVNVKGRLQFGEMDRKALDQWLMSMAGKHALVTVKEDRATLSARQRRWYFGQVLGRITKHTGQDKDDLHLYFKDLFLGSPENKLLVIVDANGVVIDEREVLDRPSITVLSTTGMTRYCEDIRMWAADRLALDIPNPDSEFRSIA